MNQTLTLSKTDKALAILDKIEEMIMRNNKAIDSMLKRVDAIEKEVEHTEFILLTQL